MYACADFLLSLFCLNIILFSLYFLDSKMVGTEVVMHCHNSQVPVVFQEIVSKFKTSKKKKHKLFSTFFFLYFKNSMGKGQTQKSYNQWNEGAERQLDCL